MAARSDSRYPIGRLLLTSGKSIGQGDDATSVIASTGDECHSKNDRIFPLDKSPSAFILLVKVYKTFSKKSAFYGFPPQP